MLTQRNQWNFIGQDAVMGIGLSATINKFKHRYALEVEEKTLLSNPHSS